MTSWSYRFDPIKTNGYSQMNPFTHNINSLKGRPDSGNGVRNVVSSDAKLEQMVNNQKSHDINDRNELRSSRQMRSKVEVEQGNFDWLTHYFCPCYTGNSSEKIKQIIDLNRQKFGKAIVFTGKQNTKLQQLLQKSNPKIDFIVINQTQSLSQRQGKAIQFLIPECKILITNLPQFKNSIIDIQQVNLIINEKLIEDPYYYRQRLLRSKNFDSRFKGVVISLVGYEQSRNSYQMYQKIQKQLGLRFQQYIPKRSQLNDKFVNIMLSSMKTQPQQQAQTPLQIMTKTEYSGVNIGSASQIKVKVLGGIKKQPQINKFTTAEYQDRERVPEMRYQTEYNDDDRKKRKKYEEPSLNQSKKVQESSYLAHSREYVDQSIRYKNKTNDRISSQKQSSPTTTSSTINQHINTETNKNDISVSQTNNYYYNSNNFNEKKDISNHNNNAKIDTSKTSIINSTNMSQINQPQQLTNKQMVNIAQVQDQNVSKISQQLSKLNTQIQQIKNKIPTNLDIMHSDIKNIPISTVQLIQKQVSKPSQDRIVKAVYDNQKNVNKILESVEGKVIQNIVDSTNYVIWQFEDKVEIIKKEVSKISGPVEIKESKQAVQARQQLQLNFQNILSKITSIQTQLRAQSSQSHQLSQYGSISFQIQPTLKKSLAQLLSEIQKFLQNTNNTQKNKEQQQIVLLKTIQNQNNETITQSKKITQYNSKLERELQQIKRTLEKIQKNISINSSVNSSITKDSAQIRTKLQSLSEFQDHQKKQLNEMKQMMVKMSRNQEIAIKNNTLSDQKNKIIIQQQAIDKQQMLIKGEERKYKEIQIKKKQIKQKDKEINRLREQLKNSNNQIKQLNKRFNIANQLIDGVKMKISNQLLNNSQLFTSLPDLKKQFLCKQILSMKGFSDLHITRTKKLFEKGQKSTEDSFLSSIADKRNLLMIAELQNKNMIAAFSQDPYMKKQNQVYSGDALLVSITNNKIYKLKPRFHGKGIRYDEYVLIFGNNDLNVYNYDMKYSITFGNQNGFFETYGNKIEQFVDSTIDEGHFLRLEFHQIFMEQLK